MYSFPIVNKKAFLMKKCKSLLVPYLVWVSILWFYRSKPLTVMMNWKSLIKDFFTSGFWFLRILFYVFVLMVIALMLSEYLYKRNIRKISGYFISIILTVIIAMVLSSLPGCDRLYKHYILFMFGMFFYWVENNISMFLRFEKMIWLLATFFYWGCVVVQVCFNDSLFGTLADYASAFFGILFIVLTFREICKYKKFKTIAYLGKNTLGIYAFHWCVLYALGYGKISILLNSGINDFVCAIVLTVIWIVLSVLFIKIVSLNDFFKKILI